MKIKSTNRKDSWLDMIDDGYFQSKKVCKKCGSTKVYLLTDSHNYYCPECGTLQ
jgi:Zn finger protein HypA/HybF involved in hydrogenase expression